MVTPRRWRVYPSPLVVTPFGHHAVRETPLRTGGTRGLPESRMPHSSSLIHQVWWSHCNMHTHKHIITVTLESIMLPGLSRTITFTHK